MEVSNKDLEFFDLSNASEEDVKEIRAILNESGSNGCVELPWELPLNLHENSLEKCDTPNLNEEPCDTIVSSNRLCSSVETVVGQTLLYTPLPQPLSAPQLPIPNSDIIPQVEAYIPTIPPMSAASAIGSHYPTPYFVPRTLSYLRAYPPVGLPILTCAIPGSGELTHVPSPYAPFLPVATPPSAIPHQPRLDKEESEIRMKVRGPPDRQYNRRNRKKLTGNNYYATSIDYGHSSESFQDSADDQTVLSPTNIMDGDRLPAVPSSLPVVPIHMQPQTFPATSGALPMHSYPPGLHPLSYSQISCPQPSAAPLYYVPVFNPSYSGYIPSASTPVMLPMQGIGMPSSIHPASESECSVTNEGAEDVTKSSESLVASSSESAEKTSVSSINVESDCETSSLKKSSDKNSSPLKTTNDTFDEIADIPQKIEATDNCSPESSDTLVESVTSTKPLYSEDIEKNRSCNTYHDNPNSPLWTDLFKKQQHSELNGLDRRPISARERPNIKESTLEKDINGKLYNVPNSDNVL